MTRPSVGSKLGNYRIERVLGEGRMGIVYLAYDEALLRRTAVKVLAWKFSAENIAHTPDAHMLAEAQLAARINHPNVVRVYGVARHREHCFIGMEYVDGISAEAALRKHGVFSFARTNEILIQAATGLQAVHDAKVVHRDLKPENLLIAADGTTKIVDFGMALQLVSGRATETNRAGTPLYTAPELWQGRAASIASDIYALGATYYFLLTGSPPFDADDLPSLIEAHRHQPPPDVRERRPDLPERCHRVIQRCLAKSPADRYGSAQEVSWEARGLLRQPAARPQSQPAADSADPPLERPTTIDGFRPEVFGPLDPDDPHVETEPFGGVRARLSELGTETGPALALLIGPPGSGRTTLACRLVADYRRDAVAIYIGADDAPGRSPLHSIARNLGVIASLGDARSTVDRIIQHLAGPATRKPALIAIDCPLSPPALADLALLARGAKASGGCCLLAVGGPELPAMLEHGSLPEATAILQLPPLDAEQTMRYVDTRLRHAQIATPSIVVTPDAGLLLFHHTAGNLVQIDRLMLAMLARASREARFILSSRDVELAVDPDATPEVGWPTSQQLELVNARRRSVGLAPRRRAESVAHPQVELVSQRPDVNSVVLSHVSGAVLEARGELDGEVAGTVDACCVRRFAAIGELLGLGELRSGAMIGARATRILHCEPGLVLASTHEPTGQLLHLEHRIADLMRP